MAPLCEKELNVEFETHVLQLDSLEKLDMLLDACRELGVSTRPRTIDGVGIIPLFSWYHKVKFCGFFMVIRNFVLNIIFGTVDF